MPTLVLLIPYNEGVLLLSDRQSTKNDGTKEEWDKLSFLENSNIVLGFAADSSEGARTIAQSLKGSIEEIPFVEQYRMAYQGLSKYSLTREEKEIVALCVIKRVDTIESYRFTRDLPELLTTSKPIGIGSGAPIVRPQLDQNTNSVSVGVAIEFGKTLIEYASRVANTVGPPSQFGFNIAIVPLSGNISFQRLRPEQISLEKILYRVS